MDDTKRDSEAADEGRFLRFPEVIRKTGLARSTIYIAIKDGGFPQPIRIGKRSVAFDLAAVSAWMEQKRASAGEG